MIAKTCLNGLWDFSCETNSLEQLPSEWDSVSIKVPSPFNINSFSRGGWKKTAGEEYYVGGADFRLYPEYPQKWENAQIGFYRRRFFVGKESEGRRIFLHFDAVAYRSVYYVNGQFVQSEGEAFLPIEMEITDFVRFGEENELIVGCQTAKAALYKDENNRDRTDLPEGSFWGGHIGGIWQDCWLVERAQSYVEDVFAYADVENETLHMEFQTVNAAGMAMRLSLSRHGADAYREIGLFPCEEQKIDWQYTGWNIDLWEPERPALYDLRVELQQADGTTVDTSITRIGFRTFAIRDRHFVLNGRPIRLKNDSWHYMGYAIQTEEYARSYFKMAKEANVNIIRLHAMPYPSFFYEIADEMGMMMVSESAIWASHCRFSYSPVFFENGKKHLRRLILRDRNHPSIVMWSPENECIPAFKVCGSKYIRDIEDLSEKLYDLTQEIPKMDPSRLYSCDGSRDLGGRLDVNSLHYPGYDCPTHREKPITIGENGSMYYSTPDNVCVTDGESVLHSFEGRLEAVASECYHNLIGQRKWADQVCVFNLIWYGLEPLPFEDRLLTYDSYETPGIKPSRITPYLRTLNAGAQADLPEYIPNPVWQYAKKAFAPVRPFLENAPVNVWGAEQTAFPVTVFNDNRDPLLLTLTAVLTVEGKETAKETRELYMDACTYQELSFTFAMPMVEDRAKAVISVSLCDAAREYETDSAELSIYNRDKLQERWEKVKILCLHDGDAAEEATAALDFRQGADAPYGGFIRHRALQTVFTSDTFKEELMPEGAKLQFNTAHDAGYFEEYLSFNAVPIYFNGAGMPLALDVTTAGQPRIACSIDLPALADTEPAALLLMIRMAEYLRAREVKEPTTAYFYGNNGKAAAALLNELRCAYEQIDSARLEELMTEPQDALLIVDGSEDLRWMESIHAGNFRNVLVLGLTKVPDLFAGEFRVTGETSCHLQAVNPDETVAGMYSNNLYALSEGRQTQLAVNLLEYQRGNGTVLLGLPKVDWRMWNQKAEYLKTVSVHKSELEDRSRFAALSRHDYAGSAIYFCQLSMQLQNTKSKHLMARILSAFHVRIELAKNVALDEVLTEGIYGAGLNRILCREIGEQENPADFCPGLNRVENGTAWKAVSAEDSLPKRYALAVFVYSPSDRTDLLLNPDTVELTAATEQGCELWLNGEKLKEGEDIRINSITLCSGWNTLMFVCRNGGPIPSVRFTRYDLSKLDLRFSLYGRDIQLISLQNAVLLGEGQTKGTEQAISGKEAYWVSSEEQREGINFDICLETPSVCRALYFSAMTSDIAGCCYTPKCFDLLAGETQETMEPVYSSLFEDHMSYRGGRVFVDLGHPVSARYFRIALKTNALKPLVISDLTLLGE